MIRITTLTFLLILSGAGELSAQEGSQPDPAGMMKKMEEHATPGMRHALLGHLIGKWKTEMSVMGGPPTAGTAEFRWILGKRYVQQTFHGTMMGKEYEGMSLFGYDNYKKKFTGTWIDTLSTTKNDGEGLLDRTGRIITWYGTMDEYLTGEHDKPVRYVLDLTKDDELRFEVHDLVLGDNSKVIDIHYSRAGK